AIAVKLTSRGPVLYWSERVGRDNRHFDFPKFRSMRTEAPQTLQHLVGTDWTTPLGRFLRKTSLDELPQLFSILKGDMSFVGPRPVLVKEDILVAMRTLRGVHHLKPGL
ncbi:MAG: sugar transferase, partial [Akkermansiaceae bacterium]|nr:sugar transferase [Akkermansiaceae bacterium]